MSEQAGLAYAKRGVRAMAIRLPQVHGADGKAGLITYLLESARAKGTAAYVGDGSARWAAAHRLDVARLYRLALEKGTADGIYHAVGEEGVPMRQIVEVIGRALNVPVISIKQEEAGDYYGPLAMFAGLDMPASSALTQKWLGWKPKGSALSPISASRDIFREVRMVGWWRRDSASIGGPIGVLHFLGVKSDWICRGLQ